MLEHGAHLQKDMGTTHSDLSAQIRLTCSLINTAGRPDSDFLCRTDDLTPLHRPPLPLSRHGTLPGWPSHPPGTPRPVPHPATAYYKHFAGESPWWKVHADVVRPAILTRYPHRHSFSNFLGIRSGKPASPPRRAMFFQDTSKASVGLGCT